MRHVGKRISKRGLKAIIEDGARYYWNKTQEQIKLKEKNMQKKIITKKSAPKRALTRAVIPKTVSKKKPNPALYYQCMSACCQKGGLQGQKITQIAHQCKVNSPALIANRTKQVQELQKALAVVSKFAQSLEKVLINH